MKLCGLGRFDCLRGLGGILVNLFHFQAQLDSCNRFLAESEKQRWNCLCRHEKVGMRRYDVLDVSGQSLHDHVKETSSR
jgi:hypothetical protein